MGIGDSITLISCLAGLMLALPALLIFLSLVFHETTYHTALRLNRAGPGDLPRRADGGPDFPG
jgi:hypothetical protein